MMWKNRFERYMSVSGNTTKKENEQIDIMIYLMGEKSEEILSQFKDAPKTFEAALQEFDNYFQPKKNVIF